MMFSDEIRSICSTDLPGDDHDPSGHRRRLRVRMEKEGWDALRPHEMLELALYPILPRQDLSGLARTLVDRFGSLRDVFDAPPEALAECPGMTETLARWICVTGELLRAYCDAVEEDGLRLGCFGDIRRFLETWRPGDETGMWALFLDFGFNLISHDRLGGDKDWWTPVNVRRLASEAVSCSARCTVFVRFLDDASPFTDFEISQIHAISHTLTALDVHIIDCVLTGGGQFRSLNLEGRLDAVRQELSTPALFDRYLRES